MLLMLSVSSAVRTFCAPGLPNYIRNCNLSSSHEASTCGLEEINGQPLDDAFWRRRRVEPGPKDIILRSPQRSSLSVCGHVRLSVCLSLSLSRSPCFSFSLSLSLFLSLSLSLPLSLSLSFCLSISFLSSLSLSLSVYFFLPLYLSLSLSLSLFLYLSLSLSLSLSFLRDPRVQDQAMDAGRWVAEAAAVPAWSDCGQRGKRRTRARRRISLPSVCLCLLIARKNIGQLPLPGSHLMSPLRILSGSSRRSCVARSINMYS